MTVSTQIFHSGPYNTDGATASFSITFPMQNSNELVVSLLKISTGIITPLVFNIDFTVTLNADQDTSPGGTIAIQPNAATGIANNSGQFPSGYTLTITPDLSLTQNFAFPEGGEFPSASMEAALDRLTLIAQQQQNVQNNSIQIPSSDSGIDVVLPDAAMRANKALIFDSGGNVAVSVDNYNDQETSVAANAAAAVASASSASASAATATSDAASCAAAVTSCTASQSSCTASASSASSSATAAAASAATASGSLLGTSTTSATVGTGSKTFTTQSGLGLQAGSFVVVASSAGPANYFHGQVTAYSGTSLTVNVLDDGGSGTYASWTISLSSPQGASGSGSGTVNSATGGQLAYYASNGTTVSGDVNATVVNGLLTLGQAGSTQGSINLAGSTSGNTTLAAPVTGNGTMTLQAGSDTLTGRATTDTLTNKTFDTAGTGNSFKINGQAISSVSGNTSKAATITGSLTNGHVAVFDSSGNIKDGGAVPSLVYSSIAGCLITSLTGSSTTAAATITAGQAADSTNASYITCAGYSWAASNGNAINGTDAASSTLANSTTYHIFVCSGGSGTGTFCSASLTPTFPTGYATYSRRIGSFKTNGSGAPLPFTQIESSGGAIINYLTTQVQDINTSATGNSSRTLYTMTVPQGISVQWNGRIGTTTGQNVIITSPFETDVAPSPLGNPNITPGYDLQDPTSGALFANFEKITNTSGQIGARASNNSTTLYGYTSGWIDFRRS